MKRKNVIIAVVAFFLAVGIPLSVGAQADRTVFVPKDRVFEYNFFRAGGTVDVAGTLEKDAYVVGEIVTIDGTVKGDVIGAAQVLRINGTVEGNLRFAAETIIINGTIGKNVTVVASTVIVGSDASVGWEFLAMAETLTIDGTVGGNVNLSASTVMVGGSIDGQLRVENKGMGSKLGSRSTTGPITGTLNIIEGAHITGDVVYISANELIRGDNVVIDGQVIHEPVSAFAPTLRDRLAGMALSFLMAFVVALALIKLMPKFVHSVADTIKTKPSAQLWRGALVVLVVPLAAVLLAITIIGFPLAMIVIAVYLIALYIAKIFFAVVLAESLAKWLKIPAPTKLWVSAAVGLALYILIAGIPIIGWIFSIVATFMSVGALYTTKMVLLKKHYRR